MPPLVSTPEMTRTVRKLMFSYDLTHEEGEKYESRHYFDESNRCIEVIGDDEGSQGLPEIQRAQQYLRVFDLVANMPM